MIPKRLNLSLHDMYAYRRGSKKNVWDLFSYHIEIVSFVNTSRSACGPKVMERRVSASFQVSGARVLRGGISVGPISRPRAIAAVSALPNPYKPAMAIYCLLGRHKPSMTSISRGRHGGHAALCEACGCPLESHDKGPWRARKPLYARSEKPARMG